MKRKMEFLPGTGWFYADDGKPVYQEDFLIPETGDPLGFTDYGTPHADVLVNSSNTGHWVMSGLGSLHKYPFRDLEPAERYAQNSRIRSWGNSFK